MPDTPHSPNRPLLIAAGAVLGLLIGLALAFAVELLRKPLRSPSQIETMGLPILGVVPLIEDKKRKSWFRLPFRKKEIKFA
jgi:capsular polysaccharide biosynthesis protein